MLDAVAMKIFATLIVIAVCASFAVAESPPVKIYTTEEGLSHDNVNRIVRDSRGFLWFCTGDGLSRFDGAVFRNYTQDHGLPNRSINDLLETADGRYLIATSSGLAIFNPEGKASRWDSAARNQPGGNVETPLFSVFYPVEGNRKKNLINGLSQSADGSIWAGTDDGLFRIEISDGGLRFIEADLGPVNPNGISVSAFATLHDGAFLVGSTTGLFKMTPGRDFEQISDVRPYSILQTPDGRLWMDYGGETKGIGVFELAGNRLKLVDSYSKSEGLPENAFFFSKFQTDDGRIFIGQHDGLSEFIPETRRFRVLGHEKVTSMTEDAAGNLWVGTELRGAWKIARRGFTIFGPDDGIAVTDDIRAIYESRNGHLVIPVRPRRMLLFDNGKFLAIEPVEMRKRSWGWKSLDLLSMDGEWWIPTEKGLLRFPPLADPRDLARVAPKKIYTTADGLPGDEIFQLFEDSRGDIWFSIIGVDYAIVRWDRKTGTFHPTSDADGLPKFNGPVSVAEDRNGTIWFGFYFGGLVRYRDGRFRIFGAAEGIPESQIIDLLVDSKGRLWLATSGQGVYRIDDVGEEVPRLFGYSTLNGLSSNQATCLAEDLFGRIYAGTGRGINRIDLDGGVRIFSQSDGLPSNLVARCAADRRGALWFVSQNTLLRFTPEAERPASPPPVLIDRISVAGIQQRISELGTTDAGELDLAPDGNQVQIGFFALSFGSEGNIRYQYRLDGREWSAPGNSQQIDLNLSSGRHVFEVRAIRSDMVATENPAIIVLHVASPVWTRWWFLLLSVAVIASVLILMFRYRTQRLREVNQALTEAKLAEERLRRAREERLAELETVRSRIATDLHDDIGASLTQIAVLSQVAQAKSTDAAAAEPLLKISDVSNELVGTMSDIVWSINPAKDHVSDLTQRMRRFASDVLSPLGIGFSFDAPRTETEKTLNTNVRREVFLIFKEAVNNIVKHASARRVRITLGVSDDRLEMSIEDDGRGFDVSSTDFGADSGFRYGGTGLDSIRRRAKVLGGELRIDSALTEGTELTLSIPIDSAEKE